MLSRILLTVFAIAVASSPASAFDPVQAYRYASPDQYRPNVDRLIAHGAAMISGADTTVLDVHTAPPTQGVFAHANGPLIDYCSVTGCLSGPHLLGGIVTIATSRQDASAQESGVSLNFTAKTGRAIHWMPNTAYSLGQQVHAGNADAIYEVITAGTSASSGLGPSFCPTSYEACYGANGGNASTGVDGSVTWKFIGAGINDGKSGFSNAVRVLPGAGHTWGMNSSMHIESGVGPIPMFGFEFDTTNDNQDYGVGGAIMANIFLNGSHAFPGTAAIYATMSGPVASYAWHYGILFQGDQYVKDATIADATSSAVVFQALGSPHTHNIVFDDQSNAAVSLRITGNKSLAGIDLSQMTGTALALNMVDGQIARFGSHSLYASGGSFRIAKGADNTPLLSIDGVGNTSFTGGVLAPSLTASTISVNGTLGVTGAIIAPGLPIAAGATKGTLCVDSAGNVFVKTTPGACL